ncbi:Uncharacterised protein [Mycobacteroides abscessus subsp. massiliense]|nr:Uncharacterised protein [Mycobacteroides abscessus subsp. massiliense]SKH51358.1 Uncharacterised protein [Mycobacteroides abscessus subsp. massiliense]SKI05589.1 Uncharacterised protein [Mycobacteroides abscessus subsp. massiliense]SKJ90223.1 Uncharacterised protein [Mycobacteroides abscessus subsp. massiliense]
MSLTSIAPSGPKANRALLGTLPSVDKKQLWPAVSTFFHCFGKNGEKSGKSSRCTRDRYAELGYSQLRRPKTKRRSRGWLVLVERAGVEPETDECQTRGQETDHVSRPTSLRAGRVFAHPPGIAIPPVYRNVTRPTDAGFRLGVSDNSSALFRAIPSRCAHRYHQPRSSHRRSPEIEGAAPFLHWQVGGLDRRIGCSTQVPVVGRGPPAQVCNHGHHAGGTLATIVTDCRPLIMPVTPTGH